MLLGGLYDVTMMVWPTDVGEYISSGIISLACDVIIRYNVPFQGPSHLLSSVSKSFTWNLSLLKTHFLSRPELHSWWENDQEEPGPEVSRG